jgi:hypothetical protein
MMHRAAPRWSLADLRALGVPGRSRHAHVLGGARVRENLNAPMRSGWPNSVCQQLAIDASALSGRSASWAQADLSLRATRRLQLCLMSASMKNFLMGSAACRTPVVLRGIDASL